MLKYAVLLFALLQYSCNTNDSDFPCPPCMDPAVVITLSDQETKQAIQDAKILAFTVTPTDTVLRDSTMVEHSGNGYSIIGGPGWYAFDIIHPDYDTVKVPPFQVEPAVGIRCKSIMTEYLEIEIQKDTLPGKSLADPNYNITRQYSQPGC